MAEAKATKKEFLEFIKERELITAYDLIERFGYSYSYACKRLSLLKKQRIAASGGTGQIAKKPGTAMVRRQVRILLGEPCEAQDLVQGVSNFSHRIEYKMAFCCFRRRCGHL